MKQLVKIQMGVAGVAAGCLYATAATQGPVLLETATEYARATLVGAAEYTRATRVSTTESMVLYLVA